MATAAASTTIRVVLGGDDAVEDEGAGDNAFAIGALAGGLGGVVLFVAGCYTLYLKCCERGPKSIPRRQGAPYRV